MLGVNQLDFINYCNALKGNYRKGVHKMETLLENPTHAKEFAKNLGGVSVVLGTPVGKEGRNSETLRSMLLASDVANDAVYTWMGQYYEFDSWDELLGDEDRCKVMMANELLWRALSASGVAMGKTVATLAGLSCSAYDDMSAVAASSTAMTAIAASTEALKALNSSSLKKTYTVSSAGTNSYVTVKSGNLLVLSLIGTGSNMWTAKGFTVPNTGNITFNTTAVTLCKTANNLQVAYGSSSTSQTATITGIPV